MLSSPRLGWWPGAGSLRKSPGRGLSPSLVLGVVWSGYGRGLVWAWPGHGPCCLQTPWAGPPGDRLQAAAFPHPKPAHQAYMVRTVSIPASARMGAPVTLSQATAHAQRAGLAWPVRKVSTGWGGGGGSVGVCRSQARVGAASWGCRTGLQCDQPGTPPSQGHGIRVSGCPAGSMRWWGLRIVLPRRWVPHPEPALKCAWCAPGLAASTTVDASTVASVASTRPLPLPCRLVQG